MFSGFKEIKVELPESIIHAWLSGIGEPLPLLHGYAQSHVMWHVIAEKLARHYFVVAADLRGYGDSIAIDQDFALRDMAQDQVSLMKQLGHSDFHVVAHDSEASTAPTMALDHSLAV